MAEIDTGLHPTLTFSSKQIRERITDRRASIVSWDDPERVQKELQSPDFYSSDAFAILDTPGQSQEVRRDVLTSLYRQPHKLLSVALHCADALRGELQFFGEQTPVGYYSEVVLVTSDDLYRSRIIRGGKKTDAEKQAAGSLLEHAYQVTMDRSPSVRFAQSHLKKYGQRRQLPPVEYSVSPVSETSRSIYLARATMHKPDGDIHSHPMSGRMEKTAKQYAAEDLVTRVHLLDSNTTQEPNAGKERHRRRLKSEIRRR